MHTSPWRLFQSNVFSFIARSTTNWKQNRNKRKKAKKKLLLVEFIWLAKYCILSWNRNSYPLSFHYFPHGHNDCVERRQFSGAEFQVPSEVWITQGREHWNYNFLAHLLNLLCLCRRLGGNEKRSYSSPVRKDCMRSFSDDKWQGSICHCKLPAFKCKHRAAENWE